MAPQVQIDGIKMSDDDSNGVATASFSWNHSGLPLRVHESYKTNNGDWRRSEQCEVIGAQMVVVKYARVLDSEDGLWIAHSLRIPEEVQDVICGKVRERLEDRDSAAM